MRGLSKVFYERENYYIVSCKPAGYPVPDPNRTRVPGKIRRVGSGTGYKKKFGPGTNMIAYHDPDR